MAKLQVYKFVNPETPTKGDLVSHAARKQTLAFNRLGSTVSSVGSIVSDIQNIAIAQVKNDKLKDRLERRKERRELDAAAEDRIEQKKEAKEKPKFGNAAKKVAKTGLGWVEKFLGPIGEFLLKIATFAITTEVLKWVGDKNNTVKLKEFLEKTHFVFEKLFGWAKGFTENILNGFGALTDPNGSFISRLGGLGKIMLGLIGLKYLMNPFSLISDILGLVDLLGRRGDRPPRVDKSKKVTQKPTANKPTVKPTVKPAAKLSPFQLEQARKTATNKTLGEAGEQGSKKATGQVLKYGGKNISKATHRFFLKVIGRGGVKGLKKLIGAFKLPLISGLLTAALNWIMGESIAKSLMMGIGDGIGTFLGGWAGGAIGALGGPAAPITIPLGAFVGAMLGGIAGEAIGGYLYDMMLGKANLGADLGAMGKKLVSGMKSLWNDYIMNGDFWAGAWETFLNIGKDVMSSAWGSMMNMWNYASGAAADFFTHMMEVSKPWREAMWDAFQKYVVNGPQELVKVIFDTILSGAKGVGRIFAEGAPILMEMAKEGIKAGMQFMFDKIKSFFVGFDILNPLTWGGPVRKIWNFISGGTASVVNLIGDAVQAVGRGVADKAAKAFAKAKEIGQAIIDPIMGYIEPAIKAINETWKIVSNLPGYVYDKGIKPIFDTIGAVWNSGPAIWEFLHRPNTFQEVTGQEVPQQEMFLGGVVKNVGNAVSGVMQSPVGQVLGTAASFIPGAAPIMAGINTLATGNPMSMLGMIPGVSGVMSKVGNFMSSSLGGIASNVISGNFGGALRGGLNMISPQISNIADNFGMGSIIKSVTGAFGSDRIGSLRQIASELGINPEALGVVQNVTQQAFREGGISARYAMEQTMEFIPIPLIIEKVVPIPQAVPINTGGNVVQAAPSSLQNRMR